MIRVISTLTIKIVVKIKQFSTDRLVAATAHRVSTDNIVNIDQVWLRRSTSLLSLSVILVFNQDKQLCERIECLNRGFCAVRHLQSKCLCQASFDGDFCQYQGSLGPCPNGFCLNGAQCYQNKFGSNIYHFCRCQPGWMGPRCQKRLLTRERKHWQNSFVFLLFFRILSMSIRRSFHWPVDVRPRKIFSLSFDTKSRFHLMNKCSNYVADCLFSFSLEIVRKILSQRSSI